MRFILESRKVVLTLGSPVLFVTGNASGLPGPAGASAYEVAVAGGFAGTPADWLASLKGEPGEGGDPGAPGDDGASVTVELVTTDVAFDAATAIAGPLHIVIKPVS